MKNLLIYISPDKNFENLAWGNENEILVKIQIDNSLELGWKREDIMLVTNFPYEYNGVKSIVIGDENYCSYSCGTPSKINAILTLFEQGLIGDDIYWFHDFDAFQMEDITLELGEDEIALTDYGITNMHKGRNGRWSTGSIFFRNGSKDIFEIIKEVIEFYQCNEEVALLCILNRTKYRKPRAKQRLAERVKKLDITYNFATRRRDICAQYKVTDLPIKVIHFHPFDKRPVYYLYKGHDNVAVCIQGKNPMDKPLVTERLIKIFNNYGIT